MRAVNPIGNLTLDEYAKMRPERREETRAWMLAHWLDPNVTISMRWDGNRVVAEQYVQRNGKPVLNRKRDGLRIITRGMHQHRPFPKIKRVPKSGSMGSAVTA